MTVSEKHEEKIQSPAPVAPTPPAAIDAEVDKWSWGGFSFPSILLIGVKKYVYMLLFLLYLIPFVNILAMLGIKIYFGLHGRRLAFESGIFKNRDQWKGFVNTFDHAGFVFFFVGAIFIGLALLAFVAALFGGR